MTAETPYQWLSRVAQADPDRVCLVEDTHLVSYGEVHGRVVTRADEVRAQVGDWEIIPIDVGLDVSSVIEILAIQHAGGVPFPFSGSPQDLPAPTAPGIAVCLGTSGSSGPPKVVPLSFANVAASVVASRARLGNGPQDRWLLCLPLDHVGGLSIIWRSLEAGGSAAVASFDASGMTIERHRPSIASMVPTMVQRLIDTNTGALVSIRSVLVGGAALDASLWQRCIEADAHLVPTYGLTEAGSQVATALPEKTDMRAGIPVDGMDVTIVGRDGELVTDGDTGLISIAGPAVFDGYLGEGPRVGPFVTRDLGRLDVEGRLHVEGRIDDVIISGGENVSLGHVAATIMGYGDVRDVCVVGIDHVEWGTVGCAMVVSDGRLESLDTMVRSDLRRHERPKMWLLTDVIPTLANGKHDLAAVRAAFEEEPWT
jgi:O-succinylbenzoic acid--CoA ligase